jgi:hypothetical protein
MILLSKAIIGTSALSYHERFVGPVPLLLWAAVYGWIFLQIYDLARYMIFDNRNQSTTTILWNMLESIKYLDKSTKKRIEATKLRIWVDKNPEINILNYWLYKIIRKSEWMNIDIDNKKGEKK